MVLEDHNETVDCICKELRRDGKVVSVAKNISDFEHLLNSEVSADACSLDWSINGRDAGSEALALIKKQDMDCGTLVYSVYKDKLEVALSEGADFVLRKEVDNYDEYLIEAEKAIQLGLLRKISNRLRELGCVISFESEPNEEDEPEIFELARKIAFEKASAEEDDEIIHLLKRRGWWKSFDAHSYSNLPFTEKLNLLFSYVGVEKEDIAQIFQIDMRDAEIMVNEKKIPEQILKKADRMLSILAFLLRLTYYEPELMPYFWTVKRFFQGSLNAPPWDSVGLYEYLKNSKEDNDTIEKSLFWIRNN